MERHKSYAYIFYKRVGSRICVMCKWLFWKLLCILTLDLLSLNTLRKGKSRGYFVRNRSSIGRKGNRKNMFEEVNILTEWTSQKRSLVSREPAIYMYVQYGHEINRFQTGLYAKEYTYLLNVIDYLCCNWQYTQRWFPFFLFVYSTYSLRQLKYEVD